MKLICEKNQCSHKRYEQKLKAWKENSTGNANKKSTTTKKNDKTKGKH